MTESPGPAAPDSPGTPDRWRILVLVAVSYFTFYLHRSLLNFVQPPLKAELDLSDAQLGLLNTAFLLPYAFAQVAVGYFGDRFRRRSVLLGSLLASTAALAGMGFATSFGQLVALRVALAIAQSASVPAIASVVADCFTPRTRSTAVGVYLGSYNLALILGARYGGKIADTATYEIAIAGFGPWEVSGWRLAMFAFAGVGLLASIVFGILFREPLRTERVAGAGLGSAGTSLGGSLLAVLRVRAFLAIGGVFVLTSIGVQAIQYWLPRYMHDRFGLTLEEAGWRATVWIQTATAIALLVGGPWGDSLARRFVSGRTTIQVAGMLLAIPSLVVVGLATDYLLLVTAMAMCGVGIGLYQANLWTTTFEVIDPAARATAIGLLNVASGLFSWSNWFIGEYHQTLFGGLGQTLAWLSVLWALAVVLALCNIAFLLPRDYRGPLKRIE